MNLLTTISGSKPWKLLLLAAGMTLGASAEDVVLSTPGSLAAALGDADVNAIVTLSVEGPISNSDVKLLRQMAGRDEYNDATAGNLQHLDLSKARIVANANDGYYFKTYPKSNTTADDVVGRTVRIHGSGNRNPRTPRRRDGDCFRCLQRVPQPDLGAHPCLHPHHRWQRLCRMFRPHRHRPPRRYRRQRRHVQRLFRTCRRQSFGKPYRHRGQCLPELRQTPAPHPAGTDGITRILVPQGYCPRHPHLQGTYPSGSPVWHLRGRRRQQVRGERAEGLRRGVPCRTVLERLYANPGRGW